MKLQHVSMLVVPILILGMGAGPTTAPKRRASASIRPGDARAAWSAPGALNPRHGDFERRVLLGAARLTSVTSLSDPPSPPPPPPAPMEAPVPRAVGNYFPGMRAGQHRAATPGGHRCVPSRGALMALSGMRF